MRSNMTGVEMRREFRIGLLSGSVIPRKIEEGTFSLGDSLLSQDRIWITVLPFTV